MKHPKDYAHRDKCIKCRDKLHQINDFCSYHIIPKIKVKGKCPVCDKPKQKGENMKTLNEEEARAKFKQTVIKLNKVNGSGDLDINATTENILKYFKETGKELTLEKMKKVLVRVSRKEGD